MYLVYWLLNDLLSMVLYDCWVVVTDCVSVDIIVIAGVDGLVTYIVLYCKLLLVVMALLIVINVTLDDATL